MRAMRAFHAFFTRLLAAIVLLSPVAALADGERITFSAAKEGEQAFGSKMWIGIFGDEKAAATCIRLDAIVSVSKHSYLVNGNQIREVTIDTKGNNSIRIYCLNASSRITDMKERVSQTRAMLDSKTDNASRLPAKSFPEGTYSHNVEYQVDSPSDIDKVYESVINAVIRNKGCIYKVKKP